MKQVKHNNGFIYYTKKKRKKHRKKALKFFIYQNYPLSPLSLLHRFSTFFPRKTGIKLKIVLPSFLVRVARDESHW